MNLLRDPSFPKIWFLKWYLVLPQQNVGGFQLNSQRLRSAVKLLFVWEEGRVIPGAPYVASVPLEQWEIAAILKGVDFDFKHIKIGVISGVESFIHTAGHNEGDVGNRQGIRGGHEDSRAVEIHDARARNSWGFKRENRWKYPRSLIFILKHSYAEVFCEI